MTYVPKQRVAPAVLECLPAAAAILKAKQQKQQAERAQLEARYDWQQHARPSQLAPEGDWQTLVWLAGRGWGKNRAASEWVRYRVEHCDKHRIALVAATAADVRDTVVEGESGILAVCPPWNRPTYQPSKRRVIWPNGAIGTLYSADEPERLRGPQHDDAFCLVGDTPVTLADGRTKPLAHVRKGDMVCTRKGARRVLASGLTKHAATIFRVRLVDGRDILATANHQFWVVGRGFVPLSSLRTGDWLCVERAWSGTDTSGTATAAATTPEKSDSIAPYGKQRTVPSHRAARFTTRTATGPTTGSTTWNCSRTASIAACTSRKRSVRIGSAPAETPNLRSGVPENSAYSAISSASSVAAFITAAPITHEPTAPCAASTLPEKSRSRATTASARIVAHRIVPRSVFSSSAQGAAIADRLKSEQPYRSNVRCLAPNAIRRSRVRGRTPDSAAGLAPSLSILRIESVTQLATEANVYDITVEDAGEFFANGVLVHNCDELASWRYPEAFDQLQFGLRLGADPRCVVTTTPKPVSLLKRILSLSSTLVIKGTTYENLDNLAPSYVDRIVKPYEGTRLGRQELNAELLDDNPDALWKREWIDQDRVLKHPDLKRVVVAVDPPATSGEGAAECGIVVVGLGSDDQGYVLDDRSIRGASPALWAREAVSAYHLYDANCIVAEVNNGGEMVEHTLRSVDPAVPIESVRASRGKYTRAEPISALYEQHRIHHVGTLADLEDQMCSWMPGDSSPDRMDAAVWACTYLFPNEGSNIIPFIAPVAPLRRDRSLGSMA